MKDLLSLYQSLDQRQFQFLIGAMKVLLPALSGPAVKVSIPYRRNES